MESEDIETALLSFTSPGIWFGDIGQTKELASQCNNYLAELARVHRGRFGGFGFLPLPDMEAALQETGRLYDNLRLDGITLLTSIDDKYIICTFFKYIIKVFIDFLKNIRVDDRVQPKLMILILERNPG